MANFEPRLTPQEFIDRLYANAEKKPCVKTVINWIKRGKIRGGSTPCWFVYESWEPVTSTGNAMADQIISKNRTKAA